MVLFSNARSQCAMRAANCFHVGCATGAELFGDSNTAHWELASDGRVLPRRSNSALRDVFAVSFCAAAAMGKHGGITGNIPGWANAGERRPLVFDGHGPETLPLDAGCAVIVRG